MTPTLSHSDLAALAGHFQLAGTFLDALPWGTGHINDTYAVRCRLSGGSSRRYILQRINTNVFRTPVQLMENVAHITRHLRERITAAGGDPDRETLNLVPTHENTTFFHDGTGGYWRVYLFIERASTYETAENPRLVYNAAWAFGNFQKQLADFPAARLHETIPGFHNTPGRFLAFQQALQRDSCQRAAAVRAEIDFILQREPDTRVLLDLLAQRHLPLRVTHNDSKFSNVMIDDQSGRSVCILDLDTVMPGLALYDFGDIVRSAAALSAEDEPDIRKAGFSITTFEALAHGYLDAARNFLTPTELEYLPFGARLITLEQAIRFLGDYLNGDTYYKVARPTHNLDRARTQIKMLREMEEQYDRMNAIVARYR